MTTSTVLRPTPRGFQPRLASLVLCLLVLGSAAAADPAAGDAEMARTARLRLEQVQAHIQGDRPEDVAGLRTLLAERNDIVRAEAVRGLGRLAAKGRELDAATILALRAALEDASPAVIVEAAGSLKAGRTRPAEVDLLRALRTNRTRKDGHGLAIRSAAARALGACGGRLAAMALVEELQRHEDLAYDGILIQALAELGDPVALPELRGHLARLQARRPTEAIARQPWQQAVDQTGSAIARLEGGAGVRP